MGFDDISGNSRAKRVIRLALRRNQLPNSLLFAGPEGIGKKSLARVLAAALNCEKKTDDACGECPSCRAIAAGRFPDVWEVVPEKVEIRLEQIKAVRQAAYLRPMTGKRRVFIIDEAEKLNEESSNALLKVLEEPPVFSVFVLVTSNSHLLLPTIRSRCRVIHFSPVPAEDIRKILVAKGYPEERAKIMSLIARGSLKQALSDEWAETDRRRKEVWGIFRSWLEKKDLSAFLGQYAFARREAVRKEFTRTMELFASFCRDLILVKEGGDRALLLNPDLAGEIEEVKDLWSLEKVLTCLRLVDRAIAGLDRYLNMSLIVGSFYSLFGDDGHA